jgi:hypothetical protein
MVAMTVIHFLFLLLLVGGILRFAEYRWPDNPLVQAIGVIY